jgi:hypothetical protein
LSSYPRNIDILATQFSMPRLPELIRRFLYDQLNPDAMQPGSDVDLGECPTLHGRFYIFHSAVAQFYAPSNISGTSGMYSERIRATPSWFGGAARNDCIFVSKDPDLEGMGGMHVTRVQFFFSFDHDQKKYPCALVWWFVVVGDAPDEDTGLWIVEPELGGDGEQVQSVIHVDSIVRGALLVPVYGDMFLPRHITFSNSLGAFSTYYVNKWADYHAHEIAF